MATRWRDFYDPPGTPQMYQRGDLVLIQHDEPDNPLPDPYGGMRAIIVTSQRDEQHGGEANNYTVFVEGMGSVSWRHAEGLDLIESGRTDLLGEWEEESRRLEEQRSDLGWIFLNGPEVLREGYGASLQALWDSLGNGSLWGKRGEGVTWYANASKLIQVARPYLESGDREGWDLFCAAHRFGRGDS